MAIETLTPFSTIDVVRITLQKHYDFKLPNYLDVDDLVQEAELELERCKSKFDPAISDYGAWHWTLVSRSTLTQLIRSNCKKRNAFNTVNLDELKQYDDEEQDDVLESIGGTVDFVYPRFPGEEERMWEQTEKWIDSSFGRSKRKKIALGVIQGKLPIYIGGHGKKVKVRDNALELFRFHCKRLGKENVRKELLK